MPDLALALPCSYSTDHANLRGYTSYKECSPLEIVDLYIPDESSSDISEDCDYEAMTTHVFKQSEPVECDCDAMNQPSDPPNCEPMCMKKKKPSNLIF